MYNMDDKQQAANNQASNQDDQVASIGGSGLQKETEPMPSGAVDFSELKIAEEKASEIESEPEEAKADQVGKVQAVMTSSPTGTYEAKEASQPVPAQLFSSGNQPLLTKLQAQQIAKGPLIFKRSSDPMLWLALLMLRHYQWLDEQEKKNKQ